MEQLLLFPAGVGKLSGKGHNPGPEGGAAGEDQDQLSPEAGGLSFGSMLADSLAPGAGGGLRLSDGQAVSAGQFLGGDPSGLTRGQAEAKIGNALGAGTGLPVATDGALPLAPELPGATGPEVGAADPRGVLGAEALTTPASRPEAVATPVPDVGPAGASLEAPAELGTYADLAGKSPAPAEISGSASGGPNPLDLAVTAAASERLELPPPAFTSAPGFPGGGAVASGTEPGTPAPGGPEPPPIPAAEIRAQVTGPVLAAVGSSGKTTLTLQLDPPQLGRVEVNILRDGNQLTITFSAAAAEAEAALQEGADKLVELILGQSSRWQEVQVRLERQDSQERGSRFQDQPGQSRQGRKEGGNQRRQR